MKMGRDSNYQWKLPSTGCRAEFQWHGRPRDWSEFTLPASRQNVPVEGPDRDFSQGWCWYELHRKESLDKAHNLPLLCQRGKVNSQGLTWCSRWAVPAGPFFPSKGCLSVYFACATFVAFFINMLDFYFFFNPFQNAASEAVWVLLTPAFTVALLCSQMVRKCRTDSREYHTALQPPDRKSEKISLFS